MSNAILGMGFTELSDAIAKGELSSVGVTRVLLDRLDDLQERVRPMAHIWRAEALRAAEASDRRRAEGKAWSAYDGVPMTLKENLAVRGTDSTLGVVAKQGTPATADAVCVRVLREAGCVFLGKTNVSQFLLFHESSNPVFGRTANPHDPARVPGGSSGGEAAAIAAYGSPAGLGTDIGGSIRVPAHFCGIVGLKPTIDRISMLGVGGALPGQELVRGQVGPMARSVRDVIALMHLLSAERCAALDPRVPPLPLEQPERIDLSKLRIGLLTDDGIVKPSPAVQRAVREAGKALEAAGAEVVPWTPPLAEELILTYLAGLSSDGGRTVEEQLAGGPADPALSMLRTMAKMPRLAKRGMAFGLERAGERFLSRMLLHMGVKPVGELWKLTARARAIQAEVYQAWNDAKLDAVVSPAHATPALPHGASRDFTLGGALSMRFNLLNFPAGVVPVTRVRADETQRESPRGRLEKRAAEIDHASAGLPIGVQIVARPYREDVVLALMLRLEEAMKGREDYPGVPLPG